ncbi:MAG: glycosyl hydrolase family protein, partial [Ruminococcus sp.]|nr:glycosyl hydrolase family protein [Ruminococcus sp.]
MKPITAELILQKKRQKCGWNIPKSSIIQTAKRNRGKKPAGIHEKTDILFMKLCYEKCQQEGENEILSKYLAAHHELIASAEATRIAHEIDPENKIGCMLATGMTYPYTCSPEDVWKSMQKDRENYFFIDVQARGEYPAYAKKFFEREKIALVANAIHTGPKE